MKKEIRKFVKKYPLEGVFVASDNHESIKKMQTLAAELGLKFICSQASRASCEKL